jgi:hypothetical protein
MQLVGVATVATVANVLLWVLTWHWQSMVVIPVVTVVSLAKGQLQRWMVAARGWLRIFFRLTEEHAPEMNAPRGQSCRWYVRC